MRKPHLAKQTKKPNKNLFFLVILFVVLGLVAIADASAPQALNNYGDKFFFLKQQSLWALIGLSAFYVASLVNYKFWEKLATSLFFISVGFLILVLIPQFSFAALGARRWISIAGINFQPSELIKLTFCIYLAKVASKNKSTLSYFIPLVVVAGLIMLQPDLGTTMVVAAIALTQIFISDVNLWHFIGMGIAGALSTMVLILTSPYRRDRLHTFLEVTSDPLGTGYHIRQVLLAIGSGGLFGVGLGASRQKYLFLPESSTDSIFAIISEELGLMGGVILIGLFAYFVYLGLKIAKNAPDTFSKVLSAGIVGWVGGQACLNIAAMVALVPLTGIPLPFISYGGSSLLMILLGCGILLNISKFTAAEKKRP